jgi:nitroreductase
VSGPELPPEAVDACIRAATAAPSVHNSQPWRFRVAGRGIDVLADPRRRLAVLDPRGRELVMSVGAAVFNLRVALRHQGWLPVVRLFPGGEPELVARVAAGRPAAPDPAVRALAAAVFQRHTHRGPFTATAMPASLVDELTAAAAAEGAVLTVLDPARRNAVFALAHAAQERLRTDRDYLSELATWTAWRPGRTDGVPPQALGPPDAVGLLPLRDFTASQPSHDDTAARFEPHPWIAVLTTAGDEPAHWLRAGQALQRVLLTATVRGVAAQPITQPLEVPALRRLVSDTGAGHHAQAILRLGYRPPDTPARPSPRRPPTDVLIGTEEPQPPRAADGDRPG